MLGDLVADVVGDVVRSVVGGVVQGVAGTVFESVVGALIPRRDPMKNVKAARRRPARHAAGEEVWLPYRLLHEDGRPAGTGHFQLWRTSLAREMGYHPEVFGDVRRTLATVAGRPSPAGAEEDKHRFAVGTGPDLRVVEMWTSDWKLLVGALSRA